MSPPDRLTSILHSQQIQAFTTYSGGDPVVCFTESTLAGIHYLIGERGYQTWAIVFDRQSVYDAGGGPVWYARPDQYTALGMIDPGMRSWAVRLDPGSDWLWEREWRIMRPPRPDGYIPTVDLPTVGVTALIVGDLTWNGAIDRYATTLAGHYGWGNFLPPLPPGLPRWWWNPAERVLQDVGPLL